MSIMERLGLRRHPVAVLKEVELVDTPRAPIRSDTLRFAAQQVEGFTDDELVEWLRRPGVARTTLVSPRVKLVRDGLLADVGTKKNARGNAVKVYRLAEYVDGPAKPVKRLTYAQLRRRLTTAELEISVLKNRIAAYEEAAEQKA